VNGAADEKSLPTAALPMLLKRISDGKLPPATTRPIGAALEADGVRLRNALAARQQYAWYRKNYWEIFEKNAAGQKWEIPARAAMQAAIRYWSQDYMASSDDEVIIYREGQRASTLGCQEPLFCYAWAENAWQVYGRPTDMDWVAWQGAVAAQQLDKDKSGYPAIIKMEADLLAAITAANDKPVSADKKKEIDRLIADAKSRFRDVLATRDTPRWEVTTLFDWLGMASITGMQDRRLLPNSLFEQLKAWGDANGDAAKSTVLTIQGIFNCQYSWDARGTGYANTVTENGWQLMQQRLTRAANALEQAWKLDPTNANAAEQMLGVELGQGQGRDRMELWFKRAMDANPDDYDACVAKLYYLEPKWYGSADEMLKFGRECVTAGNWDSGIPYILVKAHLDLSWYTPVSGNQSAAEVYFKNNMAAWGEIRAVNEELLKRGLMSNFKKLQYARIAAWTNHWEEANRMLDEVAGSTDFRFWDDDGYRKFQKKVRSHR
jgi:hypothetical protein